ncbi:hypothetical protein [Saccharopolyspora sp. NPDC002376]
MSRDDPAAEDTAGVANAAAEVRTSVMRLARRLRSERDPGELTLGRMAVLGRLERDGPATTSGLAVAERVTPQSMARMVQHLTSAGLAERARPQTTAAPRSSASPTPAASGCRTPPLPES